MAVKQQVINLTASLTGTGYAFFYLYIIGDIDFTNADWQWQAVPWSIERIISQRGPFYFEAVVMLELGQAVVLLSPVNILIASALGLLLALNIHGALYLHNRQECRAPVSSSSLAALPALLAGGACCAPALLLLIGLPGLGAFIGLLAWLVPLSFVLLLASRWWQRRLGAPGICHWL